MTVRIFANVIGFDDAPFSRTHRGDVTVVGAVFAGAGLKGRHLPDRFHFYPGFTLDKPRIVLMV